MDIGKEVLFVISEKGERNAVDRELYFIGGWLELFAR